MIFVIMGMEIHPFNRLAQAVDELQQSNVLGEEFFLQLGSCTYQPKYARFQKFLSFGEVCEQIQRASVVITHAGAGSTLNCIQQGKHPVMVPRRARWGEHVDEHQVPFAQKFGHNGLATVVDDVSELRAAIESARGKSAPAGAMGHATQLTSWLEGFWQSLPRRR